jgi:hypothetical protein
MSVPAVAIKVSPWMASAKHWASSRMLRISEKARHEAEEAI